MPIIILPVETVAREWDAKLLLTVFLAHKGAETVIGSHARINNHLHHLKADVYVSQTIVKAKRRIFGIIRDMGMRLAAWDEEGMVWSSAEFYRNRRLDPETWKMLHRFHAWGEMQASVIRDTFPDQLDILRVEGNPRQDLYTPTLRPLYETTVQELRSRYGSMILFNSNFGSLNHARYPYTGLRKTPEQLRELSRIYRYDLGLVEYRYHAFLSVCELIPHLAKSFPDRTIVIRPHPSENHAPWEEVAKPFANVLVRYDHELIPWLLAADVVIHNSCTTAVEAAMLERPVIEYRKVDSERWVPSQSRAVSMPAHGPQEVVELIRNPQMAQAARQNVEKVLRKIIAHYNDGLACERLAEDLLALAGQGNNARNKQRWQKAPYLRASLRGLEKAIVGHLFPKTSANPAYISRKFPPMQTEQVRERLHVLAKIVNLPCPQVEQLADRIWRISPA